MTIYSQPLWFGNCAADAVTVWGIVAVLMGAVILGVDLLRRRLPPGWRRSSGRGLQYGLLIILIGFTGITLTHPYPRRLVQIAMTEGQIALRFCDGFSDIRQSYRADTLTFRHIVEERGTSRVRHHMLEIQARDAPRPVGTVEFRPESRFDFTALGKIASGALADYSKAIAAR